jgi:secondary thiamine-phosphate synthase enzyme
MAGSSSVRGAHALGAPVEDTDRHCSIESTGGEGMRTVERSLDTRGRRVVDVTDDVGSFAAEGGESGLLHVFVPHATAGVALMETGSGSEGDLEELLERLVPRDDRYAHRHGAVGHGGDHLLPALVSPSLVLRVDAGRVVLGTWQRIVIVDPNRENDRRRLLLSLLAG